MKLPQLEGRDVARVTLLVLGIALGANMAFNSIMASRGYIYPYTNMFMVPTDRFADFFKLLGAFQGPIHASSFDWSIDQHVRELFIDARRFIGSNINPYHMAPLAITLTVLAREAIGVVDPILLFLVLLWGGLMLLAMTLLRAARDSGDPLRLAIAGLLTYPVMFMADRGHFFSLICGIATIYGSARMLRVGRLDRWAMLAFVIALNIRPNLVLIPAILSLGLPRERPLVEAIREMAMLGLATVLTLVAMMGIAHWLYPYYGWERWHIGLSQYRRGYIDTPDNYGFTISLVTPLRIWTDNAPWVVPAAATVGGAALMQSAFLAWKRALRPSELMFLAVACAALAIPAYAAYHLMPILLVPILLASEGGVRDARGWAALVGTLFVLAPKNYVYGNDHFYTPWSYQVVVDPLVLLAAVLVVLALAWRDFARAQGAATPAPAAATGAA